MDASSAVPTIVRWLVSFCGLRANVAVSSVAPPAISVQVVCVIEAPLVVKIDALAVIAYEPMATFAMVATVVSDVANTWLPSR